MSEVNVSELKLDALPEAAKKEMWILYQYLVFKYLNKKVSTKKKASETNKHLTAFHRFKKLRDRINPVVDKSINIDQLINEGSRDIF
jgi:hypothetical protein